MANASPLEKNGYKVQLFQTIIYRTILLASGQLTRDPSAVGGMA
jgi:xanthine dehydrogenase YagS FAD-binding subunit